MGGAPTVDKWEIAVMHREHEAEEGSWCRVTWLKCDPSEIDSTVDFFKDTVMTKLEENEAFCSGSFLVDRASGRCCGTARFDSRDGLEATREMAEADERGAKCDVGGHLHRHRRVRAGDRAPAGA